MNQHVYTKVAERPPLNYLHLGTYKPGSLDDALAKLKAQGRKVIDFWLAQGHWVFKVMAPR